MFDWLVMFVACVIVFARQLVDSTSYMYKSS